eukprot:TRINITY_DN80337_c0_g1_i1.p1 TRINITY_DN80337_c0_g1~~TRINITY_DN80337_c0_g1_i1.p1  ORF type:complete len:392 (+),score=82.14 TRINITY_DN80337_c0_g1_i1:122-1177(+)
MLSSQTSAWRRRALILAVFSATAVGCVFLLSSASGRSVRAEAGNAVSFAEFDHYGADNLDQDTEDSAALSQAPLMEFYMYRVQSAQDYSPENQNMANIGGVLWYMHSEIVWHHWIRAGSFSSTPKTRIERFLVKTRATPTLYRRGMNFGVVNTFDLGQCSGPFKCENLEEYGPTVGCESWTQPEWFVEGDKTTLGNNFPHNQWVGKNLYPGALWYSLPGDCMSRKFWDKDDTCNADEPGGACPEGVEPTGATDCTYSYRKVGEISIDDLEGISSFKDFIGKGGEEYVRRTDKGVQMDYWDHISSPDKCQERIDRVKAVFAEQYPEQHDLPDPICDFDVKLFYPNFPNGTFD